MKKIYFTGFRILFSTQMLPLKGEGFLFNYSNFREKITISPEEAKYIATCVYPKFFLNDNRATLLNILNESIKSNSSVELNLEEFCHEFPTLAYKIREGIQILDYFESMEYHGHNQTLLRRVSESKDLEPRIFKSLVNYACKCSVQLGRCENGKIKIWSPFGVKESEVDRRYVEVRDGKFFTTHGENEFGMRIAIRCIEDEKKIESLKKLEELWRKNVG